MGKEKPIIIPPKLIPKIDQFTRRAAIVRDMTGGKIDLDTDDNIRRMVEIHNSNRVDRKDLLDSMGGKPLTHDPTEVRAESPPEMVDIAGTLTRGKWRGIPGSSKVIDVPLSGRVDGKRQIRHENQRKDFVEKQIRDVFDTKSKRQRKNLKRAMRKAIGIPKGSPIEIK